MGIGRRLARHAEELVAVVLLEQMGKDVWDKEYPVTERMSMSFQVCLSWSKFFCQSVCEVLPWLCSCHMKMGFKYRRGQCQDCARAGKCTMSTPKKAASQKVLCL